MEHEYVLYHEHNILGRFYIRIKPNKIKSKKGAKQSRNTKTRGKIESINKITTFYY